MERGQSVPHPTENRYIYQRVIGFGIFSFFISGLYHFKLPVSQPILGTIIPSIVLGLLLVFRTDTAKANFSSADLSSANLICADLKQANLSGAILKNVGLSGANLEGAYLSWCKFKRC